MDSIFKKQLEAVMPKSLDDIIRTNRDKLRAYVSADSELDVLRKPIAVHPVKAEISGWAFVTLFAVETGLPLIYLTGYNDTAQCSWMTSCVTAIDGCLVETKNGSLYRLVGHATEALDLLHICATLNSWGVGQMFGIPNIHY